jgi:hypothetical protein
MLYSVFIHRSKDAFNKALHLVGRAPKDLVIQPIFHLVVSRNDWKARKSIKAPIFGPGKDHTEPVEVDETNKLQVLMDEVAAGRCAAKNIYPIQGVENVVWKSSRSDSRIEVVDDAALQ